MIILSKMIHSEKLRRKHIYFFLLLLLNSLFFSTAEADDDIKKGYEYLRYAGFIQIGFERCEFRPNDIDEVWWLNLNSKSMHEYNLISRLNGINIGTISFELGGYLSPERTPGFGHFSAYKREFINSDILRIHLSDNYIYMHNNSIELPPPELIREYASLVSDIMLQKSCLSLKAESFQPQVLNVRKDDSDHYLLRTATAAFWFAKNQSGCWKLEKYLDKPIMQKSSKLTM